MRSNNHRGVSATFSRWLALAGPPPLLVALLFTALLTAWESAIFGINYPDFFVRVTTKGYEVWDPARVWMLALAMLGSFAVALAYVWVSLRSTGWVRVAAFVLFGLAATYEYGYYTALGRFSSPEDVIMALLYSDPALFRDAIWTYLNLYALVPSAVYGALLLMARPARPLRPAAMLLVLSAAVLLYSLTFRAWYLVQSPFPTASLSAFLRTATYAPWKYAGSYNGARDPVGPVAAAPPAGNVIFVVDESIRDDHLSLNGYARPTTPFLEQLEREGMLYNWGLASSGAICSLSSNNLLLTGFSALPDTGDYIRRWPTIFQYARAMGYRTSYLDSSNPMFWNGTRDDLRYIDRWENADVFLKGPAYDADLNLAARLRAIVAGSSGNFIWVNKRGVHFFYNNTFPADQARWTPVMAEPNHDPAQRERLVNSYDNGLRYNLEGFFRTLLADPAVLANTVVVYTSDHGQTLAEHGEHWSHCRGEHASEARVPLFLIGRPSIQVDTGYAASHTNLFPTLLDLLGVPAAARLHPYGLSLLEARAADSTPRRYYVGDLNGVGGEYRPFDIDGPRGLTDQAAGAGR